MKIELPTVFRGKSGGLEVLEVDAPTVDAALKQLTTIHRDLHARLFTEEGKLRPFYNFYLNDGDIRYLPLKADSPVCSTDKLIIVVSLAGG